MSMREKFFSIISFFALTKNSKFVDNLAATGTISMLFYSRQPNFFKLAGVAQW